MRLSIQTAAASILLAYPARGVPCQISAAPGRPIVIFVHGRAQAFRDRAQLETQWFGAAETGFEKIGMNGAITSSDRRLVYYAAVYEPQYHGSAVCANMPDGGRSPEDLGLPGELEAMRNYAYATRGNLLDRIRANITRRLSGDLLIKEGLKFLDDTQAYLDHKSEFCNTDLYLEHALDSAKAAKRPVVLVGHSMGTLVSYAVLSGADERSGTYSIRRFVSLGSQLGLGGIVPLLLGKNAPSPTVPKSMLEWVNAFGIDDYLAWPLEDPFASTTSNFKQISVRTQPGDPHGITGYLIHPWVARSIAAAWCSAFGPPAKPPAACKSVRDVQNGMRDK